jgi:peptidoglycan/LPS O-acetylase OafA/YrhL
LVFLFHADGVITGHDRIGTLVSPAQAFMTAGHTGVTLFFILSAFLLARPFLIEGRGGPVVQRRNFYRRRILRIMPLYTATILVAVALSLENPGVLIDGLRALFFLNSFTGTVASLVPYSAVWWSLATEIQFYLVLPLLGLCLRTKAGRLLGLAVLISWAIGFAIVASQPQLLSGDLRFRLSLSLLGRAPAFLAGIAACWLVLRHGERIRAAVGRNVWLRNGGSDALLLVVLFGLGLVLQQVTTLGFIRAEISAPTSRLAESFLWTLVLLLVLLAPLRSRRLITNGAFTTLGRFSYSFYLIHEPILFFGLIRLISLDFPLDVDLILRGGVFALFFLLCFAISALSYYVIERPFLLRKARIDR